MLFLDCQYVRDDSHEGGMPVFRRRAIEVALAVLAFSIVVGAGVAGAQDVPDRPSATGKSEFDADKVLDELAEAMKVAGQPDKKRALLADVTKISSLRALDMAVAAAADKEVVKEASAAAGQIAQTLMVAEQPAYIRRIAFLRWVACQPEQQAAKTVIDALRSGDVVLESGAISVLDGRPGSTLIESVAREISSFPPTVQTSLIEVFAVRSDAAAALALAGMARHKDKRVAVKAIAALGRVGGERALAAVSKALADTDEDVRDAALESLAGWADASPLPALLSVVRKPKNERERTLALRGMAALALAAKPEEAAQTTLLSALSLVTGGAAEDAVVAAAQIAQALAPSHPREARQALDKLAEAKLGEAARQSVRAALLSFTIDQLPNLARGAKASSPDGIDSDGPHPDSHAIDGDPATYWDETDGHPLYRLRVDFPKPTDVSAISVVGWAHQNFSPKDFEIVCDGKTVKTVTNAIYASNCLIVGFLHRRCTSLELKITACYGGSPAVRELGIFNPP